MMIIISPQFVVRVALIRGMGIALMQNRRWMNGAICIARYVVSAWTTQQEQRGIMIVRNGLNEQNGGMTMRLVDADALYNGAMKDEYFDYVEHDNHGRESFAYSCAMQRLADAPTIDAIPVEWLRNRRDIYLKAYHAGHESELYIAAILNDTLQAWQKEQKEQEEEK